MPMANIVLALLCHGSLDRGDAANLIDGQSTSMHQPHCTHSDHPHENHQSSLEELKSDSPSLGMSALSDLHAAAMRIMHAARLLFSGTLTINVKRCAATFRASSVGQVGHPCKWHGKTMTPSTVMSHQCILQVNPLVPLLR